MSVSDQIHDEIYRTLKKELYAGDDISSLQLSWLQSLGITAGDSEAAWDEYFDTLHIPPGDLADRMSFWLVGQGYTGSLDDMMLDYWRDRYDSP